MDCKVFILWLDLVGIGFGLLSAIVLLIPPWQDLGAREQTGRLKFLTGTVKWRRGGPEVEAASHHAQQELQAFKPRDRLAIIAGIVLLLIGFFLSAVSKIIPLW